METARCLICGGDDPVALYTTRRDPYLARIVRAGAISRTVVCRRCGCVYKTPRMDAEELRRLYRGNMRDLGDPGGGAAVTTAYLAYAEALADETLSWIERHVSLEGRGRRCLEIGCGAGVLLHRLMHRGWRVEGIEPSEPFARYAVERLGVPVQATGVESALLEPGAYDLIVASYLLEHVRDPEALLERVRRLLASGGIAYVAVPDIRHPYSHLSAFLASTHLYLFSQETLRALARRCGFVEVAIGPFRLEGRFQALGALLRAGPVSTSRPDAGGCTPSLARRVVWSVYRYRLRYLVTTQWKGWWHRIVASPGPVVEQLRYAAFCYSRAPVTWLRRVALGRDPYWRQYFYSRWGAVPEAVRQRLAGRRPLWVIARSGGEVTQSRTLCRLLAQRLPDRPIVFSTQTADTYRAAQRLEGVAAVFDHPWDLGWVVRRVLAALDPAAIVCVENATYPVLLAAARARGVPVLVVSGFMSRNWEAHPMAARPMRMQFWRHLDRVGAKTEDDRREFLRLGVPPERVIVTGNLKYDAEQTAMTAEETARWRRLLGFDDSAPVLIGGSISEGEIGFVLEAYRRARERVPGLRLLVAPRYIAAVPQIEEAAARLGLPTLRRSRLTEELATGYEPRAASEVTRSLVLEARSSRLEASVVIVDTFGELPRLYALGSSVFLGATIAPINAMRYGQNLIEPLLHRKPVFFGPYHRHWEEETAALRQVWPGLAVATAEELAQRLTALLADAALVERIAEMAEQLTAPHRDAASRTAEFIEHALGRSTTPVQELVTI